MASPPPPHFVIFPFMSKGHIIPLLHLARLLDLHSVAVTIFTTPSNSPFIRSALTHTVISVVDLPFPDKLPAGLPDGVESTDQLPSMSLFVPFARATKLLQPRFEQILSTLPFVTCMISDVFLGWTFECASRFGIPQIVSYAIPCSSVVVSREYRKLKASHIDEPFSLTNFPWVKIANDERMLEDALVEVGSPLHEFTIEIIKATSNSWGILFNGLYEIEAPYVDYWIREYNPIPWCLGPLCLADPPRLQSLAIPLWMQWLDARRETQAKVLYIAFGTQANVPSAQLREIAAGLERSNLSFFWVVRLKEMVFEDGFCERTKDRGLIVRDWVDQTAVLGHESVGGFLSHCGWNSVLESICAAVPILGWPMIADQFLIAKRVEEELGIGLRILANENITEDDGLVRSEKIEKMARELMLGDKGKEARNKVKILAEAARRSMEDGGSSSRTLDRLIHEVTSLRLKQL